MPPSRWHSGRRFAFNLSARPLKWWDKNPRKPWKPTGKRQCPTGPNLLIFQTFRSPLRAATFSTKILERMGIFLVLACPSEAAGGVLVFTGAVKPFHRPAGAQRLAGFRGRSALAGIGLVAGDRLDLMT